MLNNSAYLALADAVLVLHVAIVLFVIGGLVLIPVSYTHLTLPTN